ncbi:MAG TPA: hypothetical protein PKY63_09745, partial [Bacteroidales bacterium]|nr:hypothetical protein [Bacteroidales bacterium]
DSVFSFISASIGVRPLSEPCADFTGFPNAKMSPPATIPGWENARPEQSSHLHKKFLEKSRISNIPKMPAQSTVSLYMVFGSENMRSAEIIYSKRSAEVLSGCLFEERSDELYPVGADRLFSRKPYQATSFSGVYAAESGNTFLEVYPELVEGQ